MKIGEYIKASKTGVCDRIGPKTWVDLDGNNDTVLLRLDGVGNGNIVEVFTISREEIQSLVKWTEAV